MNGDTLEAVEEYDNEKNKKIIRTDYDGDFKVYVHLNTINKKMYIGQTCQKKDRRYGKDGIKYKGCTRFFNAIKKYGWDKFEHIILFENLTSEMADIIEKELIKKYNTTDKKYGYNLKVGGHSDHLSEKHKAKIGKKSKMRKLSPESRKKISDAKFGIPLSEETKQKLKDNWYKNHKNMIGVPLSEERKQKIRNSLKGRKCPEEQKKKLSIAFSGENNPWFGKTHTQETKEKISRAKKGKLIGDKNPSARAVFMLDKDTNAIIVRFPTMKEAAKYVGTKNNVTSGIVKACKGETKVAYGYKWEYAEDI